MQGLINLLKPTGLTSSDAVVRVRGILRRFTGAKVKTGHMGTLDPGASGVLVIGVGNAARLFNIISGGRKLYRAGITFGAVTDTLDSYGSVISSGSRIPESGEIQAVLSSFTGEIQQVPPDYSAITINGVKAYKLARKGEQLEFKARKVTINSIKLINKFSEDTFTLDIDCMGGTYIRSLVRDIADSLGAKAYMSSLIRLESSGLKINESITLEELEAAPEILPAEIVLYDYPEYRLDYQDAKPLINGLPVVYAGLPEGRFKLIIDGRLFALASSEEGRILIEARL